MPLCKDNSGSDGGGHNNVEGMSLVNNKTSVGEGSYQHIQDNLHNLSMTVNSTTQIPEGDEKHWLSLNELQMIKVIVLVVVVGILLISTCKIIFKTFSRYSGKRPDTL